MRSGMLGKVLGGLLGASLAVVGCGGGDSGGASNKDQFISQLCAEFADCCVAAGRPGDGAQCRAFYGAFAPATGFDATAANACLKEVRAIPDKCGMNGFDTPSCRLVFADGEGGSQQPGETCDQDSDCAAASEGEVQCQSHFVNGASEQKCQVSLPGKVGSSPCIGTVEGNVTFYTGGDFPPQGYLCDKADGLTCDSQSRACAALIAVGESCTSSFTGCVVDAYCGTDGKCTARAEVGAACQSDNSCVETAGCDSASKLCVAKLATGAACETSNQCASGSCTNAKCEPEQNLTLAFLCGTN